MSSTVRLTDGQFDFAQGVDSSRVSTIKSALSPNGLARNQVAWATNASFRGGGISQRLGWKNRIPEVDERIKQDHGILQPIFQGGYIYAPLIGNPYLVLSLSGHLYKVLVEAPYSVTELNNTGPFTGTLTGTNPKFNPPQDLQAHFCQAEEFLIIQAGDGTTLPLFYDGTKLWRSLGIISANNTPVGVKPYNELPAALPMDYYMGRLWYGQGRQYCAGDIVQNTGSGTLPYNYRDSVLKVTENEIASGGDGFIVPSNAGNIRAISHVESLDTQLGRGTLFIFTRQTIYKLDVPITRTDWVGANPDNLPFQTVAQRANGSVNDRCLVPINGDLFYRSLEPGIRSLRLSIRNVGQWGNVPISNNENRALQFEDRALLNGVSGIAFQNRLLQGCLPVQTLAGIACQGIIPLDFDLISTLQEQLPPAFEGMYEGLLHLQLFQGVFGGLERAFSVTISELDGSIQLWELSSADRFDNENYDNPASTDTNENKRVQWDITTPAFTFSKEFELKRLDGMELHIDKVFGKVNFTIEYRPDMAACWELWTKKEICSAKNSCENVANPTCYPVADVTTYRESFKVPLVIGKPPIPKCNPSSERPSDLGMQFQLRITIRGWCRVRGLLLFAIPFDRSAFQGLKC